MTQPKVSHPNRIKVSGRPPARVEAEPADSFTLAQGLLGLGLSLVGFWALLNLESILRAVAP